MKVFSNFVMIATLFYSLTSSAELKPYSKGEYDTAIKSGKGVLLDFHASWCPTCKKQEPLLNELLNSKGFEGIEAFKVNYDDSKELKNELNVSKQSTLIVFKNGKEVQRSTGVTSKDELKKLLDAGK